MKVEATKRKREEKENRNTELRKKGKEKEEKNNECISISSILNKVVTVKIRRK